MAIASRDGKLQEVICNAGTKFDGIEFEHTQYGPKGKIHEVFYKARVIPLSPPLYIDATSINLDNASSQNMRL